MKKKSAFKRKKIKINTDLTVCGFQPPRIDIAMIEGMNIKPIQPTEPIGVGLCIPEVKPIDTMITLVKPSEFPICVMSNKTAGIEPVFSTKYIRKIRDENGQEVSEEWKDVVQRMLRKTTDT